MEVTSADAGERQRTITIVVSPAELAAAKQDVAKRLGKRATVPGYRPGTAPLDRLEALLGAEALEAEAVERLAGRGVRQAVPSGEAYAGATMSASVTARDPFTIEVTVPLQPSVALGDYHALRVPPPAVPEVSDEDVERVVEGLRQEMGVLADVDRAAAPGDVLTLGLTGRHGDDVVFEDDAVTVALDPERWDATRLPPGVREALVGAAPATDVAFTVTYPAFWPAAELQEQPVSFTGHVTRVAEVQLPALDDTFAASVADVDTLDELRMRIRAQMEERARRSVQDAHVEAAIDALVAGAEIAFPPQVLQAEVSHYVHDLKAKVEEQGLDFEHWLSLQPEGAESLYRQIEAEAAQRIRRQLALTEFCSAEGIKVRTSEIDEEVRFFGRLVSAGGRGDRDRRDRGRPQRGKMPSVDDMRSRFGARILSSRAVARLMAIVSGQADGDAPAPAPLSSPADPRIEPQPLG